MHTAHARPRLAMTLALAVALSALIAALVAPQPAAADDPAVASGQLPLSGSVSVHDPTMVYDEGTGRYVVASTHNSIRSAPTMNGPWTTHGNVSRAPWTFDVPNSSTLWAPHLHRIDDTYYYFYSQSSFGSQNSGIGVKTTTTPTVPSSYVDQGEPIITSGTWHDAASDGPIDHNAIDPAILQDEGGQWWIVWGSFWDGIVIQRLEFATDGTVSTTGEMTLIADRVDTQNPIEGPAIFHRNGWYYLLTGWDSCCSGADSTYKITVGRSRDIAGPYLDKNDRPLTEGGGTTILDSRVAQDGVTPSGLYRAPGGPDVWVEGDVTYLVYHAYRPQNTLAIRPMDWHDDWPYFQEEDGGPYDLSDGAYHRLVSEAEPFDMPDIERVPGPGGFGDAVDLNGSSPVEFVELPEGIVSEVDGDFTIAAWVNRATTSGQQWARLFDLGTGGDTNASLTLQGGTGGPRYAIRTMGGADIQDVNAPSSARIPVDTWTHVAVTQSGTTVTIHVNGEAVASGTITHRLSDLGVTHRNWFGRSQFSGDPQLNASLDDVNIFGRALSPTELQALVAEPGGGDAVGGGDIAWYRFDEGGGASAIDSSPSASDARLIVPHTDADRLQNPVPSDQCLTATGAGDGINVIQADCEDEIVAGQVWRLERANDGSHRFRSTLGGGQLCLTIDDASGQPGTNVQLGSCGEGLQDWSLEDTGHGFHRLSARTANLALEIENEDGVIGTNVVGGPRAVAPTANQWPPQQWQLTRVSDSGADVLATFEQLLDADELGGIGPGNSGNGRLGAFRNQLTTAIEALEAGDYALADDRLHSVLQRLHVEGAAHPSHFVGGPGAAELTAAIDTLRTAIGG